MSRVIFVLLFIALQSAAAQSDTVFTVSWNMENLFDTMDDPLKRDDDYLETGRRNWTEVRLNQKLSNLARIIEGMYGGNGPDILGVQEVENEYLLIRLNNQYLGGRYGIAHIESPDIRGIDNALLYDRNKFSPISVKAHTVTFPDDYVTRDILEVELSYKEGGKLYCFVNHWPSRRGGREESEPRRIRAAETLRGEIERIFTFEPGANILILGDFNDDPNNISLTDYLRADELDCDSDPGTKLLFNLSFDAFNNGLGTYMYKGNWNMLDQIIASSDMIDSEGFYYVCDSYQVLKPDEIITPEGRFKGAAIPTYGGGNYLSGFSDHFPVGAKFVYNKR